MNIVILQSQCQDVQEMPSQYERSCVKYDINTLNQFSIHTAANIYALRIIYMYAYCSSVVVLYISAYLIFVIFFTRIKFLENKTYTEKTRILRQNTQ